MRFEYADGRMPVSMTTNDGSVYYLSYDQVGSLRIITDASGKVVKMLDYDSFGNIYNDSNPAFEIPFGFAGGLYDRDTGLVRFGYRDYDPDVGRWTAKDPIRFAGGDTDLYGYCLSDPINLTDPLGLQSIDEIFNQLGANGAMFVLIANDLAAQALRNAQNSGLSGLHNGPADAYRHCYWNCRMTQEIGEDRAKKIGDIHEACGNNPPGEISMDLTNNNIGRNFGTPGADCHSQCIDAARNGTLQTAPGGTPPANIY